MFKLTNKTLRTHFSYNISKAYFPEFKKMGITWNSFYDKSETNRFLLLTT